MASSGDPALGAVLAEHLAALSAPGKWAVAAVAVSGDEAAWFLSDAARGSAFHIGSVTKTITALALAAASVDGGVALADELGTYLAPAAGADVRLVDLATHTAGFPKLPREVLLRTLRHPRDPYSRITDSSVDRALARLTRPRAKRKRSFCYSNFGYGVLGRALVASHQQSFFGVVRAAVLDPLGLTVTTSDVALGTDRVAGHDPTGRVVPDWHNAALAGCGSLWSTIDDMHRYLVANMRPETTVIADALRMVHTPRVAAGPGREVGLGWIVSPADRGARHWHNGGTSGFGAFVGFNAPAGVGVGVLTSCAHRPVLDRAAMGVLDALERRVDGSGRLGA